MTNKNFNLCCKNGNVQIPPLTPLPPYLRYLFESQVYHVQGGLQPLPGEAPDFAQVFTYDPTMPARFASKEQPGGPSPLLLASVLPSSPSSPLCLRNATLTWPRHCPSWSSCVAFVTEAAIDLSTISLSLLQPTIPSPAQSSHLRQLPPPTLSCLTF